MRTFVCAKTEGPAYLEISLLLGKLRNYANGPWLLQIPVHEASAVRYVNARMVGVGLAEPCWGTWTRRGRRDLGSASAGGTDSLRRVRETGP